MEIKPVLTKQEERAATLEAIADLGYVPFHSVDAQPASLMIRTVKQHIEYLCYSTLLRVAVDRLENARYVTMFFSSNVIELKGYWLEEIADAIGKKHCTFVEQYNPQRWGKLTDTSWTVINEVSYSDLPAFTFHTRAA